MGLAEFAFIEWLRKQAGTTSPDVVAGIGDDMAVLAAGDEQILITTDTLLEGVHFAGEGVRPEEVGYKAMACSLSDCAAMAARPWAAVAAVSLPRNWSQEQVQKLYAGMQEAAERYDCPLVGGDTTSWDKPLAVTVTMLARAAGIAPVRRAGAQAGDALFVTGELGGSGAGGHLRFEPRVREARQLAELVQLHAMIDVSDGLAGDLRHICRASEVGAILEAEAIPISPAVGSSGNRLQAALTEGEDFELLFCVDEKDARRLEAAWPGMSKLRLTRIGRITTRDAAPGPHHIGLRRSDGTVEAMKWRGWEHTLDER